MEVIPKEVAFAAAKLDAFNRNRYRIETTGATTAGPSSIVTINLPDAAVLDLRTSAVFGVDHTQSLLLSLLQCGCRQQEKAWQPTVPLVGE